MSSYSNISLCLDFPNLDTMAFFLVFVIALPYYLFYTKDYDTLKFYLPMLVMIAITLSEAGKGYTENEPVFFKSLYPNFCKPEDITIQGFLSKNLINLLALVGLLIQTIQLGMATSNLLLALINGLVTIGITFSLAQTLIPLFMKTGNEFLRNIRINNNRILQDTHWQKYVLGFIMTVFLVLVEYLVLSVLFPYLTAPRARNSSINNLL